MPRAIAPGMFFLRLKGIGVFDLNLSFIKCSCEHTNLETSSSNCNTSEPRACGSLQTRTTN